MTIHWFAVQYSKNHVWYCYWNIYLYYAILRYKYNKRSRHYSDFFFLARVVSNFPRISPGINGQEMSCCQNCSATLIYCFCPIWGRKQRRKHCKIAKGWHDLSFPSCIFKICCTLTFLYYVYLVLSILCTLWFSWYFWCKDIYLSSSSISIFSFSVLENFTFFQAQAEYILGIPLPSKPDSSLALITQMISFRAQVNLGSDIPNEILLSPRRA